MFWWFKISAVEYPLGLWRVPINVVSLSYINSDPLYIRKTLFGFSKAISCSRASLRCSCSVLDVSINIMFIIVNERSMPWRQWLCLHAGTLSCHERIEWSLDSCKQVYSICFAERIVSGPRLELVLVGYLPACVLDRIVLPGVHIVRMLENFGQGFHP